MSQSGQDEDLYRAWRAGDREAGAMLAQRYGTDLLRFFAAKAPDAAEDLTQQTSMGCMATRMAPEDVRSFRALLFGIARKQLLRHFEGRGQLRGEDMMSRVSLADLRTTPTQQIAREQGRDLLAQSLAQLVLDQQLALELRYWQGLSLAEVGEVLGLTEDGASSRIRRARLKLREVYAELAPDAELPPLGQAR